MFIAYKILFLAFLAQARSECNSVRETTNAGIGNSITEHGVSLVGFPEGDGDVVLNVEYIAGTIPNFIDVDTTVTGCGDFSYSLGVNTLESTVWQLVVTLTGEETDAATLLECGQEPVAGTGGSPVPPSDVLSPTAPAPPPTGEDSTTNNNLKKKTSNSATLSLAPLAAALSLYGDRPLEAAALVGAIGLAQQGVLAQATCSMPVFEVNVTLTLPTTFTCDPDANATASCPTDPFFGALTATKECIQVTPISAIWGPCTIETCEPQLIKYDGPPIQCVECFADQGLSSCDLELVGEVVGSGVRPCVDYRFEGCTCIEPEGPDCSCNTIDGEQYQYNDELGTCTECLAGTNRPCSVDVGGGVVLEGEEPCIETANRGGIWAGICPVACCDWPQWWDATLEICASPSCTGEFRFCNLANPLVLTAQQSCNVFPNPRAPDIANPCLPYADTQDSTLGECLPTQCVLGATLINEGTVDAQCVAPCSSLNCGGAPPCNTTCTEINGGEGSCADSCPDNCIGDGSNCGPDPCVFNNRCTDTPDVTATCTAVDVSPPSNPFSQIVAECTCPTGYTGSGIGDIGCLPERICGVPFAGSPGTGSLCDALGDPCVNATDCNCDSCLCTEVETGSFRCTDVDTDCSGVSNCNNNNDPALSQGYCIGPDLCSCVGLWKGDDCGTLGCPGLGTLLGECNGRGSCSGGVCLCDPGWGGLACDERECPDPTCNGRGECNLATGTCRCDPEWVGGACNLQCSPDPNCAFNGFCVAVTPTQAQCQCNTGFSGDDCATVLPNCPTGNGECFNGGTCNIDQKTCTCPPEYEGNGCEAPVCGGGTFTGVSVTRTYPVTLCYQEKDDVFLELWGTGLDTVDSVFVHNLQNGRDYLITAPTEQNATYFRSSRMFLDSGTYEISLRQDSGNDCDENTLPETIVVGAPVAVFYASPTTLLNTLEIQVQLWVAGLSAKPDVIEVVCDGGWSNTYTDDEIFITDDKDGNPEYGFPRITIPEGLAPQKCGVSVDSCGLETGNTLLEIVAVEELVIDFVDPPFVKNTDNTGVLVVGSVFVSPPTIILTPDAGTGGISELLRQSAWLSPTKIQTVIPAGATPGTYSLYISQNDGKVGVCRSCIRVTTEDPPFIESIVPGYLNTDGSSSDIIQELYGDGFDTAVELSVECQNWLDPLDFFFRTIPQSDVVSVSDDGTLINARLRGNLIGQDFVCVIRATNPDGSYFDYSAVVTRVPSNKLGKWRSYSDPETIGYDPNNPVALNIARRGVMGISAAVTSSAKFIYAIGGDRGRLDQGLRTVEAAQLDKFGGVISTFVLDYILPTPLTFGAIARIGRFLYYTGGWDSSIGCASDRVYRAEVLDPTKTPDPFLTLSFGVDEPLQAFEDTGNGDGVVYYRVSAVFAPDDENNPDGESLPGYLLSLFLGNIGGLAPIVTITWDRIPDAIGYRIYRSPQVGDGPDELELLYEVDGGDILVFTDKGRPTIPDTRPLPLGSTGKWHLVHGQLDDQGTGATNEYTWRMNTPRWGHVALTAPGHWEDTEHPDKWWIPASADWDRRKTNQWYLYVSSGRDCDGDMYSDVSGCPEKNVLGCGQLLNSYEAMHVEIIPDPPRTKIREFQNSGVVSSRNCSDVTKRECDLPPVYGWGTPTLPAECGGFLDLSGQIDNTCVPEVLGPANAPVHLAGAASVFYPDLPGLGYLDAVHVIGNGYANIEQGNKGVSGFYKVGIVDDDPNQMKYPGQYRVNDLFSRCEVFGSRQDCTNLAGPNCRWTSGKCQPGQGVGDLATGFQQGLDPSAQNYGYCSFQAFGLFHAIGGIDGQKRFPGKPDTESQLLPQNLNTEGRLLPNPGLCCTDTVCDTDVDLQDVFACSNFAGEPKDSAWEVAFAGCIRENGLFFMVGGMLDDQLTPTTEIFRTTN